MAYSGSFVIYGRGRLLITNVGMQTEVGKIAGLLKETKEKKTPLQRNLDDFGKKLSTAADLAGDKAKDLAEIGKLKLDIAAEEKEINNL